MTRLQARLCLALIGALLLIPAATLKIQMAGGLWPLWGGHAKIPLALFLAGIVEVMLFVAVAVVLCIGIAALFVAAFGEDD